jgi:serine/threonine-protein kinase
VAAALPGGDPLAAALAAGETPSPELVAQAGAVGGLKSWVASLCVALAIFGVSLSLWNAKAVQLVQLAPLERPPAYLATKAQELLADLGYNEAPRDFLFVFDSNEPYIDHLRDEGLTASTWDRMRSRQPAVMTFTYRQSPEFLLRINPSAIGGWMDDPPGDRPGMIQVDLDPTGRLIHFKAIPWEVASSATVEPDWRPLFEAAGLDPATFEETEPTWNPPVFSDSRRAWLGRYPEGEQLPIRIEAAGVDGRVAWFRIIEPWIEQVEPGVDNTLDLFGIPIWFALWFVFVLIVGVVLAARNLRLGRGDQQGAFRTAVMFGVVRMTWLLCAEHFPSGGGEVGVITGHLAYSAYRVCLVWIFYIALEPYARRLWPQMLTSWFRLLKGQVRDPLVGRDILVGVTAGGVAGVIGTVQIWVTKVLDGEAPNAAYSLWSTVSLRGGRHIIGAVFAELTVSIWNLFMIVMMFLFVRLLVRKTWIAVIIQSLMMLGVMTMQGGDPVPFIVGGVGFLAVFWVLLFRFGLLSFLVFFMIGNLLTNLPLTHDLSAWYAGSTWMTLLVIAGLTAWAFYVSLAGRPVFKDELLSSDALTQ